MTSIVVALLWLCDDSGLPSALQRHIEARGRIATGVIEFTLLDHATGRRQHQTCQLANDDMILVRKGDDKGVVFGSPPGHVSDLNTKPQRIMQTGEQVWVYFDDQLTADFHPVQANIAGPLDLRSLGLTAMLFSFKPTGSAVTESLPGVGEVEYQERREGDLHVVVARRGENSITWWIDPDRGWNASRVVQEHNGKTVAECRNSLTRFDGIWFPESVDFFSPSFEDGTKPSRTVHVLLAEFNERDHPVRFTPEHIGIEAGVNITRYKPGRVPDATVFWDGRRVIEYDEYSERLRSGDIRWSARISALFSRTSRLDHQIQAAKYANGGETEKSDSDKPTQPPDGQRALLTPWEKYTLEFTDRFRLNGEQTQKAWLIHAECERRARKWMDAHPDAIRQAIEKKTALRTDSENASAGDDLLKPLDEFFAEKLKPRLEKLPTRQQRKAFDERLPPKPASSPKP